MKKFLFVFTMIICSFLSFGQNNTNTEENSNNFVPLTEIERQGDHFSFAVKESYVGEFEENPIKFMENYFDVHALLETMEKEKVVDLQVTFLNSRGRLSANFNGKGELKKNFHKCKNVLVPLSIREQLYNDHKGWAMVKNVHIAKGRENAVEEEYYRIKMKKGNSKKRLKISVKEPDASVFSSIN